MKRSALPHAPGITDTLKLLRDKPITLFSIQGWNQTEATPEPVLQSLQMCLRATYQNSASSSNAESFPTYLHSFMCRVLILLHPYPSFCS